MRFIFFFICMTITVSAMAQADLKPDSFEKCWHQLFKVDRLIPPHGEYAPGGSVVQIDGTDGSMKIIRAEGSIKIAKSKLRCETSTNEGNLSTLVAQNLESNVQILQQQNLKRDTKAKLASYLNDAFRSCRGVSQTLDAKIDELEAKVNSSEVKKSTLGKQITGAE